MLCFTKTKQFYNYNHYNRLHVYNDTLKIILQQIEKCKRVGKERVYIYKSNKYIEMCIKIK